MIVRVSIMYSEDVIETDSEAEDVISVLGNEEVINVVQRIPTVPFVRDRELGIYKTIERVVKRRVETVSENSYGETDVLQRISPVRFLRDRELGIRGTSERAVNQRVRIETDPVYGWPLNTKRKIYKWARNRCVNKYLDEDTDVLKNTKYWAPKIISWLHRMLYIAIPTGSEKRVELVVLENLYSSPERLGNHTLKRLFQICHAQFDESEAFNAIDNHIPIFHKRDFLLELLHVQDCERTCVACDKVTCKCPVETCDVV